MAQDSLAPDVSETSQGEDEHHSNKNLLGPLLLWAVVFADIGTSVYYTPGILYGNVGSLAGFFVFLTMAVFVLLTLKYAEVTHRFPLSLVGFSSSGLLGDMSCDRDLLLLCRTRRSGRPGFGNKAAK